MSLNIKPEIKPVEETNGYLRSKLFREVLECAEQVAAKYKARHKLESALKEKGIYSYKSENRFSFALQYKRVEVEFYHYGRTVNTCADILNFLKDDARRWEFKELQDDYEPGLYSTKREVEQGLSGEMTAKQFLAKRKAYALALRNLAHDVEGLTAECKQ
jgi:hypothetical protein